MRIPIWVEISVLFTFISIGAVLIIYLTNQLFALSSYQQRKKHVQKNAELMKNNILEKFTAEIEISVKDIIIIGQAFNLDAYQSRQVIYDIFKDASEQEEFKKIQNLVAEIEKEEPFDGLPVEVKLPLAKLTKLIEQSNEDSNKHLLSPLIQTLNKYVELKNEQERLKEQNKKAYFYTVVSVVIGMASICLAIYIAVVSPTAKDIATELKKNVNIVAEDKPSE